MVNIGVVQAASSAAAPTTIHERVVMWSLRIARVPAKCFDPQYLH
jgi:hypothetical protein